MTPPGWPGAARGRGWWGGGVTAGVYKQMVQAFGWLECGGDSVLGGYMLGIVHGISS